MAHQYLLCPALIIRLPGRRVTSEVLFDDTLIRPEQFKMPQVISQTFHGAAKERSRDDSEAMHATNQPFVFLEKKTLPSASKVRLSMSLKYTEVHTIAATEYSLNFSINRILSCMSWIQDVLCCARACTCAASIVKQTHASSENFSLHYYHDAAC